VAGAIGAEGRARPEKRPGPERIGDGPGPHLGVQGQAGRVREQGVDRPAAALEAKEGAVAVEALRLTGEADEAVQALLVVLEAGAEGVGAARVVDDHVAGGDQDLRGAATQAVELRQPAEGRVAEDGEARGSDPELLGDPAQLPVAEKLPGLVQPWARRVDRLRELLQPGGDLPRERAQRRQRVVEVKQRGLGLLQRRRQQPDRLAEVLRLRREGAGCDVEVGDQVLELLLASEQRRRDVLLRGDQPGEVVRLGPDQRLADDRGVATGIAPVSEGVVDRLGAGLASDVRVLSAILGRGRLVVQRRAVALEQLGEVLPRR
jgi:hypothetical protein